MMVDNFSVFWICAATSFSVMCLSIALYRYFEALEIKWSGGNCEAEDEEAQE